MKNILLLTSVYPANDLPNDNTPVVHYFAKEWVAQGYKVIVVHNIIFYHQIIHFLFRVFENLIAKHYDYKFPTQQYANEKNYILDQVNVFRVPIFKKFPQTFFSKKTQKKQLEKIKKIIKTERFVPDVIIGHWANPQLFQVKELGRLYQSKTCVVLHNDVEIIGKIYGNTADDIVRSIDVWGFRSNDIKGRFEQLFGKAKQSFLCYSGIPANNLNPPVRTFKNGLKNFLFVGMLIPRKFPTALVEAINHTFKGEKFHITFIGQGPEKEKIQSLAEKLNISAKISIPGRIPRNEVFQLMNQSDCFIMISKRETLGLVYLEAMSNGCITIGSKYEGIDGIIEHGKNGFLCNAGDQNELAFLLKNISELSPDELTAISKNAIKTASDLTDKKAAKHYIESVLQ
jgi:glycosyltransferase involved in cell wall biosynthesis